MISKGTRKNLFHKKGVELPHLYGYLTKYYFINFDRLFEELIIP